MCFYGCCSNLLICNLGQEIWHFKGWLLCLLLSAGIFCFGAGSNGHFPLQTGWSSWINFSGFTSHHSCCCLPEWISFPEESPSFLLMFDCKNNFNTHVSSWTRPCPLTFSRNQISLVNWASRKAWLNLVYSICHGCRSNWNLDSLTAVILVIC